MLPAERDEMVVAPAAVVVHVRGARDGPTAFRSPHRGRPSDAHARSRGRCRHPARRDPPRSDRSRSDALESGFGITSIATRTLTVAASATSSSTLRRAASRWLSAPEPASLGGTPICVTRNRNGTCLASARAASASAIAARRRVSSEEAFENAPTHRPWRSASNAGACTECSSRRVSESHSASCARARVVVIVEVGTRREELDRVEPVSGDVNEVIASEPMLRGRGAWRRRTDGHACYCRSSSRCAASSSRRRPKRG